MPASCARRLPIAFGLCGLCAVASVAAARSLPVARWEAWDLSPSPPVSLGRESWASFAEESPATRRSVHLRSLPLTLLVGVARLDPRAVGAAGPGSAGRASFATRPPVWPEEDGLRLGDRPIAVAETGAAAAWGAWRARASGRLFTTSGGPAVGTVTELCVARSGARHTIRLGRTPVRWGYGVQGGLLMGRSALPLWQLAWTTSRPLALPWRRSLGTWTGDLFLAYLDDEHRAVPRPLLLGHRTAWQPTRWLELAGSRTILFGGRGRTRRLTPGDLGDILLGRAENTVGPRGPSDSDQRASFEGRATLPASVARRLGLGGGEIFFEYAGEDSIDPPLPAAVGHLFGAALAKEGWQVRLEFAETVSRNRWYDNHSVYRDSHFYRGAPLGISFGPDVESAWFGVTTPPAPARLRLSRTEQLVGKITGNRERRVGWEALVRIDAAADCVVECALQRTRRIGPGVEPRAPALSRHAAVVRVTVD